ncbi:MAG: M10 family metallopeptidase C-terminal domain-containing protein [Pseudomonadota bacterium]
MCTTCQAVNPFLDDCFLEHGPNQQAVFQDVTEGSDAADSVGEITNGYVIEAGDSFHGYLGAGDRDVIEITLEDGVEYTFSLGASTDTASVQDTHLGLFDYNGAYLTSNDDIDYSNGNTYSQITFVASYSGTYYLEASTYKTVYDVAAAPQDIGSYSLTTQSNGLGAPIQNFTFDQIADQLTYGGWGNRSYAWNVSPGESLSVSLVGLTGEGQFLARSALEAWTNVLGIEFVETPVGAQIVFDDANSGAYASFNFSGGTITSASVNVGTSWVASYGSSLNSYSFQTYIHEIGHALGLAHAGNYNGSATYGQDNLYLNDSWQQTIMSYFSQTENTTIEASYAFVVTPQIGDIIAVQDLYGAAGNIRIENNVYGFNSNVGGYYDQLATLSNTAFTLIDDGGVDTLDTTGFSGDQYVDLKAETYSSILGETGNLGIARGTIIENFEGGSGSDVVLGNDAANSLNGHAGNDEIYAGAGDDVLRGGAGADRLVGNEGDDTIFGGNDADLIKGGFGNNYLYGNDGDDRLEGADDGVDYLDGGAGADQIFGLGGNDMLFGFGGDDASYGGRGDDTVWAGEGDDIVRGNRGGDVLYGETGSDSIYGGGNDDHLFGGADRDFLLGENGSDLLDGGLGNDNLTGGEGRDVFVFSTGYGFDRVKDFEDGIDTLDVSGTSTASFSEVYFVPVETNVRIVFGNGDVLYLEGFALDLLDATDFVFWS